MTVKELYDKIVGNMSAEEALMKLLEGHVITYEKLKFNEGEEIHPVMLISMAAMEMGWEIALPYGDDDDDVIGITVGTEEYFNSVLGTNDCCGNGECEGCGDYLDNIDGDGDYLDNLNNENFIDKQLNYE